MLTTPKGLSDEKAARMMAALREGRTLWSFSVMAPRLEAYFAANPGYAQEARPLIEANARAARQRKSSLRSTLTHCKYGHPFSGENLYLAPGRKERKCLACLKRRGERARRVSEQQARRVVEALNEGKTISNITKTGQSYIVNHRALLLFRQKHPTFDRFVVRRSAANAKVRHAEATARRFQILRAPAPVDDIFALLRSAVPATLPRQIRDDVIGKMALEIFRGNFGRQTSADVSPSMLPRNFESSATSGASRWMPASMMMATPRSWIASRPRPAPANVVHVVQSPVPLGDDVTKALQLGLIGDGTGIDAKG